MIRRIFRPHLTIALVLMLLPRGADAQSVRAYVVADSISIGERIDFTIAVETGDGLEVTFPELLPDTLGTFLQFGDLLVVAEVRRGGRELSDGLRLDSVIYEVTTFAIDTMRAAGVPVLLTTPSDTAVAMTDPFMLPVRSVVPADAEDIMDLMPIADFPAPVWPWLLLIAFLLAAIAAFIFWSRRAANTVVLTREDIQPSLPPHEEAQLRLAALAEVSVDTDEEAEMFCVELSDILRTYLYRRTAVHALEMTTGELTNRLIAMEADGAVPLDTHETVDKVLQMCDLAKFAEVFPPDRECQDRAADVGGFITDVESLLTVEATTLVEAPVFDDDSERTEELIVDTNDESAT